MMRRPLCFDPPLSSGHSSQFALATGRTFGDGSSIMGRAYDKNLELEQMHARDSEKTLTDHARWKAAGWDGMKPVTRVEFEMKREGLESCCIETADDLADDPLRELWSYSTGEWLRFSPGGLPEVRSSIAGCARCRFRSPTPRQPWCSPRPNAKGFCRWRRPSFRCSRIARA